MRSILAVDVDNGFYLDPKLAFKAGEKLHQQYVSATPFSHVVLSDLIPKMMAESLLVNFPEQTLMREKHFNGFYEQKKRQVSPYYCKSTAKEIFMFFNSEPFLQFLEGMTGIQGLIPDPYFEGAGYHETSQGGRLGIHADFRLHKKLHLARRLNLLIYLNKEWSADYGGCLELWSTDMSHCVEKIEPIFNRAVIFNTDATSFHGHPEPLECPAHIKRRSIALYYYTASQHIYEELSNKGTDFRARTVAEQSLAAQSKPDRWEARLQRLSRKVFGKQRDA